MIVSHQNSFIFFKPMKVAGSSVEVALSPVCGPKDILTGTAYLEEINSSEYSYPSQNNLYVVESNKSCTTVEPKFPSHLTPIEFKEDQKLSEKTGNYFKFSIVRNPWDALVSYFWWSFYGYTVIGSKPNKKAHESIKPMIFDTPVVLRAKLQNFCESHLNFEEADVGLKCEGDSVLEWFARFQQAFFLSEAIDCHLKFENLQKDFSDTCLHLGIEGSSLPSLKSSIKRSKFPYGEYYNDYTKRIVFNAFQETIERFGYKF